VKIDALLSGLKLERGETCAGELATVRSESKSPSLPPYGTSPSLTREGKMLAWMSCLSALLAWRYNRYETFQDQQDQWRMKAMHMTGGD
jgi:hypothetical protein